MISFLSYPLRGGAKQKKHAAINKTKKMNSVSKFGSCVCSLCMIVLRSNDPEGSLVRKRKNRPARRLFEGSQSSNSLNQGNWLGGAQPPNLFFQFSLNRRITSRLTPLNGYQWLLPVAFLRVFPGWTQDDSYRIRRSGRAERGVRAHSPAWSERPTPGRDTNSVSYEKAPRFPKGERRTGIR